MTPPVEPNLEAQIDRLLNNQPELAAPSQLIARTLCALNQPAPTRQRLGFWQTWPIAWRIAFFVLISGVMATVFLGWRMAVPELESAAAPWLLRWAADAQCAWNTLGTLTSAVALIVQHFGNGFILAFLLMGVAAYASCIGLGTVIIRFTSGFAGKYRL